MGAYKKYQLLMMANHSNIMKLLTRMIVFSGSRRALLYNFAEFSRNILHTRKGGGGQRGEQIGIVLDIFSVNIKRGRKREKEGYVDYPP
jgi:hypothetical protein